MMFDEGTDLILKGSIEEIVAKRDYALAKYAAAFEAIAIAEESAKEAAQSNFKPVSFEVDRHGFYTPDESILVVRKKVDEAVWRYLIDAAGIRNFMDAKTFHQFQKQLEEDPPEINVENIQGTISGLALQRKDIFRRGIINIFRGLSGDYKSHSGFKVKRQIIMRNAVSRGTFCYVNRREELADVERIFYVLDKKAPPDHTADLPSHIYLASKEKRSSMETDYFWVSWYQNGNAHIRFKRLDL